MAIESQHRLEPGKRYFADTQNAFEWIFFDLLNQITTSDQNAGLRTPKQLIATEGNKIGARLKRLSGRWFAG